ncbi:phage tail protein [Catenovulum sp. SM1970]|uniref:phage tail protein n=1 Tax=Marinifaba aquimaris TaxID=2741323 RepID=UPI00157306CA|nr:tail fiber protein [Marinifaba aquimaris]NTS76404.1 phage tail protein [Marinifaba aquimaris]
MKQLFKYLSSFLVISSCLFGVNKVHAFEPFIGEIRYFAGNFAPRGWALCDGQLLQISQYSALFSILGTTYGGDGRTTFGLPDMRGRSAMHPGNGPDLTSRRLGQELGVEEVVLTTAQLPSHSHTLNASTDSGDNTTPVGDSLASERIFNSETPDAAMHPSSIGPSGQNAPIDNIQPSLVVNCIIALEGTYPSRS